MYINLTDHERVDIICALKAQSERYAMEIKKGNTEVTAAWKESTDRLIKKIEGTENIWKK
ncbi:MAG: hypothetical protein IJ736_08485 [Firmicutes bacterium]|nr:hypothetical protein [Bacillota bacterium]